MRTKDRNVRIASLLRVVARVWTVLMLLLFLAMQLTPDPATGTYAPADIPEDVILAAAFPGVFLLGFALSWRNERLGGILMIASYPLFLLFVQLLQRAGEGFWSVGLLLMALIFMLPGALVLTADYLERQPGPAGPGPAPGIHPT